MAWLIPAVLAMVVYLPSLGAGFVWDDDIVLQTQLTYFRSPVDAFFPPDGIPEFGIAYYRPLVSLSYMLDFGVFGRDATVGPHLTNVLLHVVVTVLVCLLARRLLPDRPLATWAAVLAAGVFAAHPIHTETVSWISGRSDTLAAAFMLGAILLALRYREGGSIGALIGAPLLYLLGLLSKEVAAATLVLVPLVFLLVPTERGDDAVDDQGTTAPGRWPGAAQQWIALGGGFLIATIIYVVLRQANDVGSGAALLLPASEWPSRVLRGGAYYLMKVVVPPPQCHVVPATALPGLPASVLVGLVGLALLGGAVFTWRRHGDGRLLLATAWFVLTLAPSMVVALGRISETPVAERYLYVPSIALSLAIGSVTWMLWPRRTIAHGIILLFSVITMVYGVLTLQRGWVWTNDLRLWSDAAATYPDEGLIWLNLGQAHFERGDPDRAMECYTTALEVQFDASGRAKAHNNRGAILRGRGDFDAAAAEYRAAIAEDPDYATAHYGLGMVFVARAERTISQPGGLAAARNHAATATELLTTALRLNPRMPGAMWGLAWARIYDATASALAGRTAEAERQFAAASEQIDALEAIEPGYEANGITIGQARERIRAIRERLPG